MAGRGCPIVRLFHRLRWGPVIELWLDGELAVERVDAVLVHLVACPDCLACAEALARLKAALSRLEVR